jgi:hypothetical protein
VSRYEPAELVEVPNHDGSARRSGDRFFALPDDEDVGDLVSASTSIGRARWELSVLNTFVPLLVGIGALILVGGRGKFEDVAAWQYAVGVAAAAFMVWLSGPTLRCSYVGTDGVRHAWKILRLFTTSSTLRFSDAVSCELTYTRVFRGGAYQGTNMRVTWRDAKSRVVYEIDTAFREYRIDREATDLDALDRCSTDEPPRFAVAAIAEFRRYQRWSAEQDA